jgi:acetyl-CoA synthetase
VLAALGGRFRWQVPARLNLGVLCSDAQPPRRLALVHLSASGRRTLTFGELARQSNRMANVYAGLGLRPGDRVAVVLPQGPETAIAHIGAYKAGLIAMPLATRFGVDALRYRLTDSGARVAVTDRETAARLESPALERVLLAEELESLLASASERFDAIDSSAEDPVLLIYTSGTTGPPKGVLHAHRVLVGQAPGFRLAHELLPRPGDLMWTPADWAWVGGLVNTLLLTWAHGVPMVSAPRRTFDPEWALDLMAREGVRNVFMPTTALRMLRGHQVPRALRLRSLMSGGEAQEPELVEATQRAFGLPTNEAYGQTEADFVIGHCASRWAPRPGSMGLPYAGHQIELQDESGGLVASGAVGEVVVRGPDPTFLIEYWRRPDATAAKFRGAWLRTGDLARRDEDGYFWFESRADDVIKSAGYRIGPGEVEECLLQHPAVANAAVVGVPDAVRGQAVKAFLMLRAGFDPSAALEETLREHVKARLAAYQQPRLIEFLNELPLTASGKVDRGRLRAGGRPT